MVDFQRKLRKVSQMEIRMLAHFNLRSLKHGRYVKLKSLENWVFSF